MSRKNLASGSPWEDKVGYSRVVRIGNTIEVSGTVAVDNNGETVAQNDAYGQTVYVLKKIVDYIEKAGASKADVIRTRMYVTDISRWQDIGKAHGEFFRDVKPVTTMVEVSRLISDDYLVEIEATAIVSEDK